jgi:amino-acid N-acetyltransferase
MTSPDVAVTGVSVTAARAEHWPAIESLLTARRLPVDGALDSLEHFVVALDSGSVVGTAGLEVHDQFGLIRSVAVEAGWAGHGLGSRLTTAILERARSLELREVYLLTMSAADFFTRHGFERIPRDSLPAALGASRELQGACPATATAMRRTHAGGNGPVM